MLEFGEDSDSLLVENLLASVSQHQRQKNGEQTKHRMRARSMNGYHVFQAPIGYKFKSISGHGKVLVRNEPYASILQEALEGYASGRFSSQVEVKRFLESQPQFPKCLPNGEIRNQRIKDFLTRTVYAGLIEVPNWDVFLREGKHEGLVSVEIFHKIQERLAEGSRAAIRKDIQVDFPLRGHARCGDCEKPLTACWSSGKKKKYPYYWCFNRECVGYRKSISGMKMHVEFEQLLEGVQPTPGLFNLSKAIFKDVWDQRVEQTAAVTANLKTELKKLDKQIEQLLDRIVDAGSSTVIAAYEKRISNLERKKLVARDKIINSGQPKLTFDELFEHACSFLSNPLKLWHSDRLEDKKAVLKLVFPGHLKYLRNEGFRM